jgi:hypothetical protein
VASKWSNLAGTALGYLRLGFTGVRLKSVGGNLAVRNAGDSADAGLTVSNLNATGSATLGGAATDSHVINGKLVLSGFNNANAPAIAMIGDYSGSTTKYAQYIAPNIKSDVTSSYIGVISIPTTEAAAFTLTSVTHFYAYQNTIGAGSSITSQTGFRADATMAGAGTNIGFSGLLNAAANSYNIWMGGTAQNYLAGELGIGTTPISNTQLRLAAGTTSKSSARIPHGVAPTTPVNGDVWTTDQGVFARVNGSTADLTVIGSGYRNIIIGGDFTTNPWVRGTTFAAAVNGNLTADRFKTSYVTAAVVTVFKTADAPTVAEAGIYTRHCLHVDVTTADASIATGDFFVMSQFIEGYNVAPFGFGQTGTRYLTLSFWHKHTKTGTHCVSFTNGTSARSYVAEYTQDVTNTWEKAVITIPVDTSGTWIYDTGIGLCVRFAMTAGATFQAAAGSWQAGNFVSTSSQVNNLDSTANDFKIALVQLEAGVVATPFEARTYAAEELLCLRYTPIFTAISTNEIIGMGIASATTSAQISIALKVPPRIYPTGLSVSAVGHFQTNDAVNVHVATVITLSANPSANLVTLSVTTGATMTAFRFYRLQSNNTAARLIFTGSEL